MQARLFHEQIDHSRHRTVTSRSVSAIWKRAVGTRRATIGAKLTVIAARRCSSTEEPRSRNVNASQHPAQGIERTQNSNFDAGTALENLRAEVIDIEALARAAEAAADALPAQTSDRQRLRYGRIQSLVTKTSQRKSAAR